MIVIVGNRTNKYDCSDIVNSADLVIRVNKMCNLDSGTVGTHTDWVVLAPSPVYWRYTEEERHWDVVKTARRVFLNRWHVRLREGGTSMLRMFRGIPWELTPHECDFRDFSATTSAKAIRLADLFFPKEQLVLVAGDIGAAWIRSRIYLTHKPIEAAYYDRMIAEGRLKII